MKDRLHKIGDRHWVDISTIVEVTAAPKVSKSPESFGVMEDIPPRVIIVTNNNRHIVVEFETLDEALIYADSIACLASSVQQ